MGRLDHYVRHIKLDGQDECIKQFVLSLPLDSGGSILELQGQPVLRIMPAVAHDTMIDKSKLKSAILKRRNESRRLNADWEAADREAS